jgi:putative membrane protein
MKLIIKLLLSALSVMIIANFLPGVTLVDPIKDAIIVAVVLAILNVLLKPILIILTLPITIVTLGLFLLIINAIIIKLASNFIDGFSVESIWIALLFSILLSFLQSILNSMVKEDKK